jgi:antitoxin CptB
VADQIEKIRKRVLFRSCHCGMKENDILLGGFAEKHVADLDEQQLDDFERLMEESDIEVLKWVIGREPTPEAFDTPLMGLIKKFNKTL